MGSFFRMLLVYAAEDRLLLQIREKLDRWLGLLVRKLAFRKEKIVPEKVFVMTYDDQFNCNPKYIVQELIRRKLPLDIVWAVPENGDIPYDRFPPEVRLVPRKSFNMMREMASAHIWIDNALDCVWYGMPKKKGQVFLNTWHGSLGIKRLAGNRHWRRSAARCNKLADYFIANSSFEENVYKSSFWPDVPVLKFGHARNDILFDPGMRIKMREKVMNALGIADKDAKLFLYAPTFRDSMTMDWFDADLEKVRESLESRFGGEWVILVRMHFKDRLLHSRNSCFNDHVINASQIDDMQELLAAVDAGMSDYSSWVFDFLLTGRPVFLYTPDIDKYDHDRGFYYPLASTPFSISRNMRELETAMREFDEDEYRRKVNAFLTEKGCYEDGHASERIADFIADLIQK